ncbi:LuxR C-terminal-related transcriptional regulator [Sporichthya sp.]|uniref:LuxR C-terminal-related transcriptional regulator n=1 Tax=Sporichthya sp. TaxID=65475 RepID=UPI0017B13FD5|nr:LuxR C-terminal-related transcriptional regulator [Sporichthya sp.]MBA3745092.1 GAF domain-containing protein [Sporichthya sp.]
MSELHADVQIARAVEAARALGRDGSDPGELIDVLIEELQRRLPAVDANLNAAFAGLVSLQSMQVERAAAEQHRRSETLARLHDAMVALRPIESPEQLLERSTKEACQACGFERAVLLRVDGSTLVPESVYIEGDPSWAAELLAASQAAPMPLQMGTNETEALRRRRPLIVRNAAKESGVPEMASLYKTTSYVAAPIIPEGRVIGFLHADYCHTGRVVDEFDRDALFAFAEGFGFAYERATLLHRLRAQGTEVRRLLSSAEAVVRSHAEAELELVRMGDAGLASARSTAGLIAAPASLHEVLTRRECEVLRLLSAGHSNSTIAEQLVVSEATVKSHVQRILRRLNVRNRIEAAAVYHRLTGESARAARDSADRGR